MCTRIQHNIIITNNMIACITLFDANIEGQSRLAKVLHEITIKPRPSLIYIACMGAAPS